LVCETSRGLECGIVYGVSTQVATKNFATFFAPQPLGRPSPRWQTANEAAHLTACVRKVDVLKERLLMKFPTTLAPLFVSTSLVFAQTAPTTSTTPAATSPTTATSAGAKPKPLSTSDKSFVKKAGESLYLLSNLADKIRHKERDEKVSPDISALSKKMGNNGDVGKAWGEIGVVAASTGDVTLMPAELKGSDKTKVAALSKLKDEKFEKEWAEMAAKEVKEVIKSFESGAKMANHPDLKAIPEKYLPAMKVIEDEAAKAAKSRK
jgi:hypothetical protein